MNTFSSRLKKWLCRARAMLRQDMFAIQVIVALLLSVLCSNALGLDYPGWAALSSFAVMNTSIKASTLRAIHRVTGTLAGGGLGLLVAPYLSHNPAFLVVFCAVIGGIAVWRAEVSTWSYSWVLGGVTAMMVMAEAQKTTDFRTLFIFTFNRIEEVALGCAICVLVTILFYPLNRRSPPKQHSESHPKPPSRLLLPLQAAIALLLVTPLLLAFQMTGFWQAMVSVLALFVLPPSAQPVQVQINQRMQQRFAGCLAATLLSLLLLPLLHHSPVLYITTLTAGVWLGCHLQQGKPSFSYFGRQFAVAWIIVFIQDTLWLTEPIQAVMRCASILMAIAIIGLVMLVFRSLNIPA
ncbi:FUSC family protein [Enterobacteriaceae bacterium H4N4]|uniref:FUSC family protein n=1 Tax=Silvania confinis TaxID=2926470 RepID=A0A9J6QL13_9ENTR|nr:FUSC family protein [Silvania confinis]